MLTISLLKPDGADPVSAARLVEKPEPTPEPGWVPVSLRRASLNRHDLWALQGVGVDPSWLPVVLGSDGAGVDPDGNEVLVYPVIADARRGGGDETFDPGRRLLSDGIDGTFAEVVAVPAENLVPKPAGMSWEAAASLGTAWLTAYRMLFSAAAAVPGEKILVQGAGGGVATALITLGRAAGLTVWVASDDAAKRARAVAELGAHAAFGRDGRLPSRVDAVMETVGAATWAHSMRSVRPGGRIVVSGATSGPSADAELSRVFFSQISVIGATMGTRTEFARLVEFCSTHEISPVIDEVLPLSEAPEGIARMARNETFGKIVFDCTPA
ncbi:zinc-binding dehydrogenase [Svornostia abyssi]|uniref:Zinc-binding dehydrogenase n=1 Tax=Svornostia abyssi TaxID=2898438 RepID=A0ABY5PIR5_9ACTN|nr:zinc-binding dehydrogenase [Parviterribacteraceae bacterium J379]